MLSGSEFVILDEGDNRVISYKGEYAGAVPFIAVYSGFQEPYLGFGFHMPEINQTVFRGNGDGAEIIRVWRALEMAKILGFADPEVLELCLFSVYRKQQNLVHKSQQELSSRFGRFVFGEALLKIMRAAPSAKKLDSMIALARKTGIILNPTDLEIEILLGLIEQTQAVKRALREAQLAEFRQAEAEAEIARPMAPADSLDKFLADISKQFDLKIGETQYDVLAKGDYFNRSREKHIPILAEDKIARHKKNRVSRTITRIGPPQITINGITWAFGAARYESGQIYVTTLRAKNEGNQPIMAEYPVRALRHLVLGENPW